MKTPLQRELHRPPRIAVEVARDGLPEESVQAFLTVRRLELRNHYEDGSESRAYRYDIIEREAMDAVAMVLFAREKDAELSVCLRSCLRPPMAFRPGYRLPVPEAEPAATQWEIPAGLVAPSETGHAGLRRCAARETLEEVGFTLSADDFRSLGGSSTLSPGVIGERVYFMAAEVDRGARGAPTEDGCPVEERGEIVFVPISVALDAVRAGVISDVKTEIGIRRLNEWGPPERSS